MCYGKSLIYGTSHKKNSTGDFFISLLWKNGKLCLQLTFSLLSSLSHHGKEHLTHSLIVLPVSVLLTEIGGGKLPIRHFFKNVPIRSVLFLYAVAQGLVSLLYLPHIFLQEVIERKASLALKHRTAKSALCHKNKQDGSQVYFFVIYSSQPSLPFLTKKMIENIAVR